MSLKHLSLFIVIGVAGAAPSCAYGQLEQAPQPQPASLVGTVMDATGGAIPRASVAVDGSEPGDHRDVSANDEASFTFSDLHPGVSYRVTVNAPGFAEWTSSPFRLRPGQLLELPDIKLVVQTVQTSVTAASAEEIALAQVKAEEKQRVFGVIPNFYVTYDKQFVPLTAKMKFELATKASTDVATIVGAALIAGINQAAGSKPDYVQGAKGYGQRFGAAYAGAASDILIGGAILPALLHQDPRYFYQGTGTTRSRVIHAVSAPFIARGDNGRPQFNFSSVGGDLASGALNNLYYPTVDRGPGIVFTGALLTTGGRIVNALAQEFIFSKVTSRGKNP
ncbi:carboxypeptidase-like regulatory domain-containing protein [Granulicella sp. WH15]|uniref:carboxypeptidase-like regulatory domain-containing protein n=1 Tax=Granulicella sp. WH15 TaxID=2602070 RepID=UPI0021073B9C|nr:carboxypeptidase-like regulatory domain-containing protein [Granulicella sp. WH15]